MAQLDDLYSALKNADAAGDVAGAQRLAEYIKTMPARVSAADQLAADKIKYSPTAGNSFGQNMLEGIGRGMASVGRGVGGLVGLTSQDDVEEAKRLDAPLLATGGGKVGNVVGNAAVAAPLAFVPGANTAVGAGLLGAGYGAATTEGGGMERLVGGGLGAAGGVAGVGLGKLAGYAAGKIKDSRAAAQVANAGKDAAVANAKGAGYVLPPTDASPGLLSSLTEGLSGKIKTSQKASAKNQPITNELAQSELGLSGPITLDALKKIRSDAGQAYDAVASAGQFRTAPKYDAALDAIVDPYLQASKSFPGAKLNPIVTEIESLRTPLMDSASGVAKIKELRGMADAAYASGNKEAGTAFKSAAGAIEDAIDGHISAAGPSPLLDAFRTARETIAKTYSVEKALNPATGDVSAKALAGQLKRGKPLSGNLKTIAETGQAFPKATQALEQNYNALSPLDYAAGMFGAGTGNPLMAMAMGARPLVRSAILSKPGQALAGKPNYSGNQLLELLNQNRLLPIAGIAPARQ